MTQALWVAKTGLDAQQHAISVISNNLANVNTVGYKKSRAVFEDLLYQNVRQPGAQSSEDTRLPSGLMLGTGVRTTATQKIFHEGTLQQTDNPLDLAINGRGFLQVLLPNGNVGYTRNGQFQLNEQGQLVNSEGYLLQPSISVPEGTTSIDIGNDGVINATVNNAPAPTQIGNLELVDFVNPAGLQAMGENLFLQTAASGAPISGTPGTNGVGTVMQGALESSNVNVVQELVDLIEAQRAYEMNSKAISTVDHILQYTDEVL